MKLILVNIIIPFLKPKRQRIYKSGKDLLFSVLGSEFDILNFKSISKEHRKKIINCDTQSIYLALHVSQDVYTLAFKLDQVSASKITYEYHKVSKEFPKLKLIN